MKTYFLYTVQGYQIYKREEDTYYNAINVSVVADNETDAKEKASKLLDKPFWRVIGVVEYVLK